MQRLIMQWMAVLSGGAVLAMAAACGGGGEAGAPEASLSATHPGVVYGKVIDAMTRNGVVGATVTLVVDTLSSTASTVDDDAATSDLYEAGDFSMANVPAGQHRLRVTAADYATYETWVEVLPSTSTYYAKVDLDGEVALDRGCSVEVYVTHQGTPVPGATIYSGGWSAPEIVAVADDAGHAVLPGLAQDSSYQIVVPALDRAADGTADGRYDYLTASRSYNCSHDDSALSIPLTQAGRDDAITITDGGFSRYTLGNSYGEWSTTRIVAPTEALTFVFNYPVTIAPETFRLRYAKLSHGAQPDGTAIPVVATLSAGNTLLTVQPQQPLPVNARLLLDGVASAPLGNGKSTSFDFGASSAYSEWYVLDPAPLGADTTVTADNLNGQTGQAGKVQTVYLEFPEIVTGTVSILSYTQDGVATLESTAEVTLPGDGFLSTDKKSGGCSDALCNGDAIHFRVSLHPKVPALGDHRADAANSVEVLIDVADAEGNRLVRQQTLTVE